MRVRWMGLLLGIGVAAPAWAKDAPDAGSKAGSAAPIRKLEPAEFKAALEKARTAGKLHAPRRARADRDRSGVPAGC